MTEEALRQALQEAHGPYLVLPPGTTIEPSRESLAQAVEALTFDELTAGSPSSLPGLAGTLALARANVAAAVRSRRVVPVVDEWNNVTGWRFMEKDV